MTVPKGGSDRFYVLLRHHAAYKQLTTKSPSGRPAPFVDMKTVWVLAVVLGYRFDRRATRGDGPDDTRKELSFWHYLRPSDQIPLLQAVALAATGDVTIVTDPPRIMRVAEEYADGGFEILQEAVRDDPEDTLETLARDLLKLAEAS